MDGGLIGEVAASLMDALEEDVASGELPGDAELLEVAVVVMLNSPGDGPGGATRSRVKFSTDLRYRQLGLMVEAMECAKGDFGPGEENE